MNTSTRGVETGTRLRQGRGWQTPVFLCSAAVVASFVFVVEGLDAPRLPVLAVVAVLVIALWLVASTRRVVPRGGNRLMTVAWVATGVLYVLAVAPLDAVLLRGLDESTSLVAWGAIALLVAAPLLVAATVARPRRR
ncbi:hypothetical protein [Curtobacterium sp. VKM Ac-1393]|uniref:hypothetical protein n=1 Tax=Curtobacterium sp. VKM Ac-1393 TaxID=2783814 RepID=UPI00188CBA22|nr:hypothetical protein [Curtobacterium sp. VKM Ac-1393]MBF4607667.1 hypothetical protein [Curtobacterium sp. VKM Ac-1393]